MRLVFNLTKGEYVRAYRRSFAVFFPLALVVLIITGVLLDATPAPRSLVLSYTEIFGCTALLGLAGFAILGIVYSMPRYLRRRAIARSTVHPSPLLDLYLTRELQVFVELASPLRLNTVSESITLEFLHEGVKIWHGASRPTTVVISWRQFPALRSLETSQVELAPPDTLQRPFSTFVPAGVLGIRRRGLRELIASIEDLRP